MSGRHVLISDIIAEAAHVFGVPVEDIRGPGRSKDVILPRFACIYLGRQLTPLSWCRLGKALGGRDHSTILNAYAKAEIYIEKLPGYHAFVESVRIGVMTGQHHRRTQIVAEVERLREMIGTVRLAQKKSLLRTLSKPESTHEPESLDDMDDLSARVAAYTANGGSFVEVRA